MASAIGFKGPSGGPLGSLSGNSGNTGNSGTPGGTGGSASTSAYSFHGGGSHSKPVPMKLFATWEVDRTPPNCIPR